MTEREEHEAIEAQLAAEERAGDFDSLCPGCDAPLGGEDGQETYCGRCLEHDPERPFCIACGSDECQGHGQPIRKGEWPEGWIRGQSGYVTWWIGPACARSMEARRTVRLVPEEGEA